MFFAYALEELKAKALHEDKNEAPILVKIWKDLALVRDYDVDIDIYFPQHLNKMLEKFCPSFIQ